MPRDTNLPVDVEFNVQKTLDARDEPVLKLTIMDRASSTAIVEVQLTAGQLLAALSGSYLSNVQGWFTPRREIIGRKMVHRQVSVPSDVIDGLPYRGPEREDAVRAWGKTQAEPGESVEPRNSNQGWKVIFRSYVEA